MTSNTVFITAIQQKFPPTVIDVQRCQTPPKMWFHVLLQHFWFARSFQLSPRRGTASLGHNKHRRDIILGNQIYKFSIFETHIFTNFCSYSRVRDYSIVHNDFIICSGHHLCNKIDHIGSAVSHIFFALMVLLAIPLAVLFYQFC